MQIIETATWGKLAQGMIFQGAQAEDYPHCQVFGLIITARCDIAHSKVNKYSYIPIVRFSDWIMNDFSSIFLSNVYSSLTGSLKNILKEAGYSQNLLDTESLKKIYSVLFEESSGKKWEKLKERFKKTQKVMEDINSNSNDSLLRVVDEYPKERDKIIDELLANRLSGHYFLPMVEPGGLDEGYVVLLREIRNLPKILANAIANGISKDDYLSLSAEHPSIENKLNIDSDEFFYPIGKLKSPNIEHLMQLFAHLFSRIGVEDIPRKYATTIWERQSCIIKDKS